MSVQRIRVGDIEVAYRFDGPEDAPVLMMAHAMGTSHRIWDPQVAALSPRYRLLRYDWRGHGDTDAPPGPYTLAQFVDDRSRWAHFDIAGPAYHSRARKSRFGATGYGVATAVTWLLRRAGRI